MGVIATTDDLIKMTEGLGDTANKAIAAIRKLFDDLDRFNRHISHESKMRRRSWDLYGNPNNRRKMSKKPMVRLRAHKKAYRNERR